jgi:hypothetical protein
VIKNKNTTNMKTENKTSHTTEPAIAVDPVLATGLVSKKRVPWNKGKKKPIEEDGELWCNCDNPKLVNISGYRGQAFCMLCKNPWYH